MALKACSECQRVISTGANPCPFCGKHNPHGMSKLVRYGGGILAIVILIGIIGPSTKTRDSHDVGSDPGKPASQTGDRKVVLTVDAIRLWKDYEANEVAADGTYKGKILQVSGTVSSIDKDFMDDVVLHLESPNPFAPTSARLKGSQAKRAAALSKGAAVTVTCEDVERILVSPSLRGCTIND